ncbi:MAG: EipA family protein [Rhizobiaceae bacterium]
MTPKLSLRRLAGIAAMTLTLIGLIAVHPNAARADDTYSAQEIVDSGHKFFGAASGGLATVVERIFSSYGLPNGYVLGEEGAGAIVGGLTYGEGTLFTKNAGDHKVFWQGPSIGWDFGANGSRLMILVYNLDAIDSLYKRYAGVAGSAYVVAGLGFNVLKNHDVLLVPVRTGVGARLGVNLGYLKVTSKPTWNPF